MSACWPRGNRAANSRASKQAWVTLHWPPPEMRTLERNWGPRSSKVTTASGAASAQVMAARASLGVKTFSERKPRGFDSGSFSGHVTGEVLSWRGADFFVEVLGAMV